MSIENKSFGGWLAGIIATVIGGVGVVWVTNHAMTDQPTVSNPGAYVSVTQPSQVNPPSRTVEFSITDSLGEGQISEQVKVTIDGRAVGMLTVDVVHPSASLGVALPRSGTYTYRLTSTMVVDDGLGGAMSLSGAGSGRIIVDDHSTFAVAGDYNEDPVKLTLT